MNGLLSWQVAEAQSKQVRRVSATLPRRAKTPRRWRQRTRD
jgi:hypothetical protein